MYLGKSNRYEVCRKLGDGTFGRVLECRDYREKMRVAVKVIRDVKRYIENARVESRILVRVNQKRRDTPDHPGGRGVVRLHDIFYHEQFFCLSFERLGKTLLEVIQLNNHVGFYMSDIQLITRELLEAIDFIHNVCRLTHTDIKMENIMLTGCEFETCPPPDRTGKGGVYQRPRLLSRYTHHRSIRLIDFGNGVFDGDHKSKLINTRQYRSPEVILEQGWDERSDIWSIGCVVAEMYTGELLFPTHSNGEHLALIERITGQTFTPEIFSFSPPDFRRLYQSRSSGYLNWPEICTSSKSARLVSQDSLPLSHIMNRCPSLFEVCSKMLRINPERRYSACRCLKYCRFVSNRREDRMPEFD
jgi:dual-specificity kinase